MSTPSTPPSPTFPTTNLPPQSNSHLSSSFDPENHHARTPLRSLTLADTSVSRSNSNGPATPLSESNTRRSTFPRFSISSRRDSRVSTDFSLGPRRLTGAFEPMPPSPTEDPQPPKIGFAFGPAQHRSVGYHLLALFVTSILLPLAVFYGAKYGADPEERELLGGVTAAFGTLEACMFPLRWFKLVFWRDHPTLNRAPRRGKGALWMDTVQWIFGYCIGIFATLFTVASIIPSYPLFLLVPPILITLLCLPILLSAFLSMAKVRTPFQMSCVPKGDPLRPLTYYIVEDVVAVDCRGCEASRQRVNTRYLASPRFRAMLRDVAIFSGVWGTLTIGLGVAIVVPLVIAEPSADNNRARRVDAALPTVLITTALWVALGAFFVGNFAVKRVRLEKKMWASEMGGAHMQAVNGGKVAEKDVKAMEVGSPVTRDGDGDGATQTTENTQETIGSQPTTTTTTGGASHPPGHSPARSNSQSHRIKRLAPPRLSEDEDEETRVGSERNSGLDHDSPAKKTNEAP